MVDQRRPSSPTRGPRGRGPKRRGPEAPLTGPLPVDSSTADALALFNQRLTVQSDAERVERRIIKQTKIKDGAAAALRAIEGDTSASPEARDAAIEAYKESVAALDRAKRNEPDRPPTETSTPSNSESGDQSDDDAIGEAGDMSPDVRALVGQSEDVTTSAPVDRAPSNSSESDEIPTGAPAVDI